MFCANVLLRLPWREDIKERPQQETESCLSGIPLQQNRCHVITMWGHWICLWPSQLKTVSLILLYSFLPYVLGLKCYEISVSIKILRWITIVYKYCNSVAKFFSILYHAQGYVKKRKRKACCLEAYHRHLLCASIFSSVFLFIPENEDFPFF